MPGVVELVISFANIELNESIINENSYKTKQNETLCLFLCVKYL